MRKLTINPLTRATGVVGAVVAVVTGVTFAALNSTATISASTLSTGTAALQVSTNGGTTFGASEPGFTITGLVPGTGTDENFSLKNTGDVALSVTGNVPTLPAAPSGGYGFSGFDNLKIDVSSTACADITHTNMQALNAGQVTLPCGALAASSTRQYTAHFDILPVAITGSQAGVGAFDLVFTGTQS